MGASGGIAYRLISTWLHLASGLVPVTGRERWLEEWRAEVWHALAKAGDSPARALLVAHRAVGALRDAWHERLRHRAGNRGPRRLVRAAVDDLRLAARTLARSPAFAAFTIGVLGVGIGVNTAVFSLAREALVGVLPFPDAERMVVVWERRPQQGRERNVASLPDFADWRDQSSVFDALTAVRTVEQNASGDSDPRTVLGARVTEDFLEVVGLSPALGRGFTAEEMTPPGAEVVLLSHGLWTILFGSNPAVLGRSVRLDLVPHVVIGVMPAGFEFPYQARYWVPLGADPAEASRGGHGYDVFGRLSAGVTVERAWSDLDVVARRLEQAHPTTNEGHYTAVYPLRAELLGDTRGSLVLLMAAVGFVLLIVCVNVANVELARSTRRSRDLGVRAALGATRARLVRQVMAESVLIAGAAGVLSVLVASGTYQLLNRSAASRVPWASDLHWDGTLLTSALVLAVGTAVLFGLAPALQASRSDLGRPLGGGSQRGGLTRGARRWQGGLVVAQVGLALVLVAGAGLFARDMIKLAAVDLGFQTDGVVTADLTLPAARYNEPADRLEFYRALEERVRGQAGIERVGVTRIMPMSGRNVGRNFLVEGRDPPENADELNLRLRTASAGYFEAMGIPLLGGRPFGPADAPDAPPVALASQTLVDRYWPDADPIGQRVAWNRDGPWITIVGVVGEVRHNGPAFPPDAELYLPLAQDPPASATLVVKGTASLEATTAGLTAAVEAIDPEQPLGRVGRLDDTLAAWMGQQRELATLVLAFALAALLLAGMGIYGVVSYGVAQRTREFGIRLALGGRSGTVVGHAMADGARLVAAGLIVGMLGTAALTRLAAGLVAEVSPQDPASLVLSLALLGAVGLLAVYVPARRATRIDPVESLRAE